jgi:hypothetical protein
MSPSSEAFEQRHTTVGYTMSMFAEEIRVILAPAGIESRLQETADGTRSITAWPADEPEKQADFSLDEVRIGPYQAHIIATIIQRSFRPAIND